MWQWYVIEGCNTLGTMLTQSSLQVPAANLLGFAGQEFARKMPKVAGILIETTFGSVVEIILFVVLIAKHKSGSSEENGVTDSPRHFVRR